MSLDKVILEKWKQRAKNAKLTAEERQILIDVTADAANLQVQVMTGAVSEAKAKREWAHLESQLASIASIGGTRAQRLFRQAFEDAVAAVLVTAIALV